MVNKLLLLLAIPVFLNAQQAVNSFPLELKRDKATFQVVNETSKQVDLFLADKTHVTAIRLNENMQVVDTILAPRPDKDYDMMVGNNANGKVTRLFWASSDHEQLYAQTYNFEKNVVAGEKFDFPFKEDRFLQYFSDKDHFYMLSIVRKTSTLRLYVFDGTGKMEMKTISLEGQKFFDYYYKPLTLYQLLGSDFYMSERPFSIQQIQAENPTALTASSKKRKCYLEDGQLIITNDTSVDLTQIISISLETFKPTVLVVPQPYIIFNDRIELNSNSFIVDGKLFQIKTSSQKLIFSIKNLQGQLIAEYSKTPDEQIDFKNSPIIQETGDPENPRILEKTSQFLRKANNQNSGLSVLQADGNYLVTLGSVSDERQSTGMVVGSMFGIAGALVAVALSNPTLDSFNAYSNRKVVYINCLFDQKGKHVGGNLPPSAFDNIRKFLMGQQEISAPTLFKFDGFYYLGYYKKSDKRFTLTKFKA